MTHREEMQAEPTTEGELYDRLLEVANEIGVLADSVDEETAAMLIAGKLCVQRATGLWLTK